MRVRVRVRRACTAAHLAAASSACIAPFCFSGRARRRVRLTVRLSHTVRLGLGLRIRLGVGRTCLSSCALDLVRAALLVAELGRRRATPDVLVRVQGVRIRDPVRVLVRG